MQPKAVAACFVATVDRRILGEIKTPLGLGNLLEQRFPGFKTSDLGVEIDPHLATETTRNWPW